MYKNINQNNSIYQIFVRIRFKYLAILVLVPSIVFAVYFNYKQDVLTNTLTN